MLKTDLAYCLAVRARAPSEYVRFGWMDASPQGSETNKQDWLMTKHKYILRSDILELAECADTLCKSRPLVEGFAGADAEAFEPLFADRKVLNETLCAKVKEHLLAPAAVLNPNITSALSRCVSLCFSVFYVQATLHRTIPA
eukprot:3631579-Alexandrium_andersonii.AAC.1